jgi:hypothetical protein
MASIYNPENPILTLQGSIPTPPVGKDRYGVNDNTGLGPNGENLYISYNITINNISNQPLGDASVRDSLGLNNGGQYTGIDVKVGDWVTDKAGSRILKIISISSKTSTSVSCTVEDVGMTIARTRGDRSNIFGQGEQVIIFEVNDEGESLFAFNTFDNFAGARSALQVEQYFKIYKPFQRFTLYPESTENLQIGDFVTITGSGTPYTLITASQDDTVIGTVADLYGGNNVNIRPFNKIITNFDKPELVSGGAIGATWYLSGSNNYTTSSEGGEIPKFFQLTDSVITQVTGSFNNPTFNTTQYNLELNNIDVIPQNIGGNTLTIDQIVSTINDQHSLTLVSSSIDERGGGFASTSTEGEAGSGGVIGSLIYGEILIALSDSPGGTGNYSSTATGEFSISHTFNGTTISINVKPVTANTTSGGYPVANEEQIVSDIINAAQTAGAPITATFGEDTITISATSEGTITINNVANDPFGSPTVGNGSGTGISTGTFLTPPIEKYLTLYREDGGDIMVGGSWLNTPEGANLYSVSGTPPYLLMLEGTSTSGADTDWFEGDTYLSASKDVQITGSLLVTRDNTDADFFIISSGSYDAFKVNSEGITQFYAHNNEYIPTAVLGGLYFTSASAFIGLEQE